MSRKDHAIEAFLEDVRPMCIPRERKEVRPEAAAGDAERQIDRIFDRWKRAG
ncbi:MAG TPA: hypothetical protein VFW81_06685 [Thermoanaerobaculia bacterium]|nr:hypothetical protein [Thermoanaerobaculia bacterium]